MKELSIFIDESGDFGAYIPQCPFYIIGMVMHDQSKDISADVLKFDKSLRQIGFNPDYMHVGPLIRREYEYANLSVAERLQILRRLKNFSLHTDFTFKAFWVEKKHVEDEAILASKLAKQMSDFVKQNLEFFLPYDVVKVYYDNGQQEITKIIIAVFMAILGNVELKKALPKDYKLSQIADLICTLTLVELKMKARILSSSERRLLGTDKNIEKYFLRPLKRKEFKG